MRSLDKDGFAVFEGILTPAECDDLVALAAPTSHKMAGSRCFLDHDWCRSTARQLRMRLASVLDGVRESVIVQCTYFNKTSTTNWLVPWHQDRTIPVKSRVDAPELTGWSRKEGMTFVHAPDAVLSDMIAIRLHLDDSTLLNGPLRVLPGSHRKGTLTVNQIEQARKTTEEIPCVVRKGGVVAMRPLLLHASSKSSTREPRRVLHFLFGPAHLPYGLEWRHAI